MSDAEPSGAVVTDEDLDPLKGHVEGLDLGKTVGYEQVLD